MRTINTDEIIQTVKEMCIEANLKLSEDMEQAVRNAAEEEDSVLGRQILSQLCENLDIAAEDQIPICQDTGMAVFFINVGQDVHVEGMNLTDAVNEGVRQGYTEGYLRKSVVRDPLIRENTKDNTPAIIHYDIVPGENIEITIAPKGFGSENMSRVFSLDLMVFVCFILCGGLWLMLADVYKGLNDAFFRQSRMQVPMHVLRCL